MISSETIAINSIFENVFIISYYDGIKEEVNIKNKTLFLWYDYTPDFEGEYWLKIEANTEQLLSDYLSNKIGVKDLIDNSSIYLCIRAYDKYFEFIQKEKLQNFDNINLPENVYLGYDFLSKLKEMNLKRITYCKYSENLFDKPYPDFSQHIETLETSFKTIKIKNVNDVQGNQFYSDDYLYPIAA